jgi:hypothetical protein
MGLTKVEAVVLLSEKFAVVLVDEYGRAAR